MIAALAPEKALRYSTLTKRARRWSAAALVNAPLIICTDIGGDTDDCHAIVCAALTVPQLKLVLTADEVGGDRARFLRYLLDLLGRSDVRVVAGAQLGPFEGKAPYFTVDGLFPDDVAAQPTDVLEAVREVAASADGPIRWVGMGPLTNLARVLEHEPTLVERLVVFQMGGTIVHWHGDGTKPEHNFKLDPGSARFVVESGVDLRLVILDVTWNPAIELTRESPLYHWLSRSSAPRWARILRVHIDRWFDRHWAHSMMHDPLTLWSALGLGVEYRRLRVGVDAAGRLVIDPNGIEILVSVRAAYSVFLEWMIGCLTGPGAAVDEEGNGNS